MGRWMEDLCKLNRESQSTVYRPLKGATGLKLPPLQEDIHVVTLIYHFMLIVFYVNKSDSAFNWMDVFVEFLTPLIKCKWVTFHGSAIQDKGVDYLTPSTHTHTHTHTHNVHRPKVTLHVKREHCVCGDVYVDAENRYRTPGADPGFGRGGGADSDAESCLRSEVELCKQSKLYSAGVQGP